MSNLAQQKFLRGKDMTATELMQLTLLDRCRYTVEKYFNTPEGFSTHEVTLKLAELNILGGSQALDVHEALSSFYGRPS